MPQLRSGGSSRRGWRSHPRGALIRVPKHLPSYPADLCLLLFGAAAARKKRTGRADQNADRSEHYGAPEYSGQGRRTCKSRPTAGLLGASANCPQKLTLYLGVENW